MANIASVFVRLIPGGRIEQTGGRWPAISDSEMLATLLGNTHGSSYCVPVWLGSHDDSGLDVQYGAKWAPFVGPIDLWQRREEADIGAIWVRWFDSGDDFDRIYRVTEETPPQQRLCRYAFDEVEARFGDRIERRALAGTYLCGNDRSLPSFERLLPSPTTPPGNSRSPVGDVQPPETAAVIDDLRARATGLSFLFRKRLVHLGERHAEGWRDYALDDWDNCADDEFRRASGR